MSSVSTRAATDDAALVAASRAGGIDAFGRLVERYQNLVCAVAYSKTGDRLLSEDIAQETFLAAWHKLDTVQEPDKVRSWLCSIARNLSSKAVRVRQREHLADTETLDRNAGVDPGPLATAITKETEATVWQALEELPESYREPLVLFYRENQSVKQVAAGLGLSEDAAKQRLSRGRQALKEGVSNLVERTLEASRPGKAFTAGVLALVGAAAAPGSAAAAQTAARSGAGSSAAGGASKMLWLGVSALALLAVAVGVAVTRSGGSQTSSNDEPHSAQESGSETRALLAALHAKRKAAAGVDTAISCEFSGNVVGADGEAIPGASIAITKDAMQSGVLDPTAINAQGDGTWRFGPVARGAYLVSITAPGHLPLTRIERCDRSGARTIEAPLAVGGSRLHGKITDIGGGPVGDVTLWLIPTLGQTGAGITTRTNAEGVYDLSVHPDRYMMLLVHPDYVLDARPVLVADESTREDFVVLPGAVVEGTVVDAQGQPVVGAKVSTGGVSRQSIGRADWMFSALFAAMFPVETDAQGRYRLTGLPPGRAQVHARTSHLVSRMPAQADLAIAETETGVEVRVEEAFEVSGFVVDDDNPRNGLANVVVLVQPDGAVTTPIFGTTDNSGYFEVAGLMPGTYRIFAAGGGAAPLIVEEVVTISDADLEDILVRARTGWGISGRISPPGRAGVRLEPASYGRDSAGALRYAATSLARAEVDERGAFRFPSVADGDYVVVVTTIDGEGRAPVTVSGAEVKDLSVEVAPLAAIEGRVVDDSGAPVVGALVAAAAKKPSAPNAYTTRLHTRDRTDSEGRFEIVGLHPASYQVRVFDGAGQRAWATAEGDEAFEPRVVELQNGAGTETVTLQVSSKSIRIEGIVVGLDGSPIEDAWVEVKARSSRHAPAGHKRMPVLTDAAGRFVARGLFGNEFEAEATGPRGKLQSAPVKTDGTEPVTLKLAMLSTVLATVERDGKLVEHFEVDVFDGPSRVIGRMVEKKNGTFELPRLISGEYKIEVKSGDGYAQRVVSVGPAPTTSVQLELQPTSTVRGRLVDEHGNAVAGAAPAISGVTLEMDRGELIVGRSRPRTGPDGRFEITGLIAGSGRIIFMRSEQGFDPVAFVELELKPGENLDLGTIQRGERQSLADAPFDDTSEDLGIRFFAGPTRPTAEQLRQIDQAKQPSSLLEEDNARLWIAEVTAGSPAEKAGLRAGDSVLAVGRMHIGSDLGPADAMTSLSQRWRSKGRAVQWTVERGGRQVSVPVLVPR